MTLEYLALIKPDCDSIRSIGAGKDYAAHDPGFRNELDRHCLSRGNRNLVKVLPVSLETQESRLACHQHGKKTAVGGRHNSCAFHGKRPCFRTRIIDLGKS